MAVTGRGGERGGGGGGSHFMHSRSSMTIAIRPSHSYNAGTEQVVFSPTRQASLPPTATRCEVFGGSHEVRAASSY